MDVQALTDKSCRDCHTTTTPLWRAGPDGPRVSKKFLYLWTNNYIITSLS